MKGGLQKRFSHPTPALEIISGAGKGRVYELLASEISLGRSEENYVVIPSESVSRIHAKIERSKTGDYVIRDNGSKNGVLVNGMNVESY